MKNSILTISLFLGTLGFSQSNDFGKLDFSFSIGLMGNTSQNMYSINEFKSVIPNSPILNKDLSHLISNNGTYFNSSPFFNLNYGIRLKSSENMENKLRVGINYRNYASENSQFYFMDKNSFDTLTSSQTGNETYIDSNYSESLLFDAYGEQLGLDISYLFYINPKGRWSFYTGVGAELGIGFNNNLEITHSSYSYTSIKENSFSLFSTDFVTDFYETETYKASNTYYGRLYVPIGLDFRLSNKHEFWSRVHIFTELRPMVELSSNTLNEVKFNTGLGWSTIGLRVQF